MIYNKLIMAARRDDEDLDFTWSVTGGSIPTQFAVAADASGYAVSVGTINSGTGSYARSTDSGATWSVGSLGSTRAHYSIATDGSGTYIAGSNDRDLSYSSNYGSSWTTTTVTSTYGWWTDILWDGSRFLMFYDMDRGVHGNGAAVYETTDGTSISALGSTFGFGNLFGGAVWDGQRYYVCGGGSIWYTSDFTTWNSVYLSGAGTTDIAFNGYNLFVAIVGSGIWTSPDGTTWTQQTDPSAAGGNAIWYAPEYNAFMVCDTQGKMRASSDGVTWTEQTRPTKSNGFTRTDPLQGMALAGGDTWVGAGYGGYSVKGVR